MLAICLVVAAMFGNAGVINGTARIENPTARAPFDKDA